MSMIARAAATITKAELRSYNLVARPRRPSDQRADLSA